MMIRWIMQWLAISAWWCLHWLPWPVLALLGRVLGTLAYGLAAPRRRVGRTNLRLCFPTVAAWRREWWLLQHFQHLLQMALEQGMLWWASRSRIRRLVRVEGLEHWQAVAGQPVIWLAPHFVGLDWGGLRINAEGIRGCSMYSRQKQAWITERLLAARRRFTEPVLVTRQDGLRPLLRALKQGIPLYYLPDQDFGPRDAVFVPFFGVPAATITTLARLASASGARVQPCVTRRTWRGYVLRFEPAWDNYPSGDMEADVRRMNAYIESVVVQRPAQYFWLHKRFKTRPAGEATLYGRDHR